MNVNLLTKVIFTALTFAAIVFYWWFTDGPDDGLWFFSLFGLAIVALMIGQSTIENFFEQNTDQFLTILLKIGILPRPTEIGLFVMAITTLLVLTVYNLWSPLYEMLVTSDDPRGFLILGIFFFGLGLSIYHVFTVREKTEREVGLMRFFMVMVLIGVSISTAVYVYFEKQHGYLILSAWSAIQALIIYILANKRWADKTIKMPTRQSTRKEFYIALAVTPVAVIAAKLFDQHWVIAFSSTLFIWSYAEIFLTKDSPQVPQTETHKEDSKNN